MDYFATWAAQKNALRIEIETTDNEHYITKDNNKIYDLSSCSYHQCFGLRNKLIEQSLIDQVQTLPLAGPKIAFELKDKASRDLLNYINLDHNGKIFYTTSGAESIENALKIARQVSGKGHVLSRKKSYHGATTAALSVTGDWRRNGHELLASLTHFIPEPSEKNSLSKTEEIILKVGPENICAFVLETITGGNGVYIPEQSWWDGITHLCHKYNILLILDEVVCGFGRTKKNFAFQNFNLRPDIVTMGKAISGGFFPFGAVYFSHKISSFYDENVLSAGLTNYAHPIGLRLCHDIIAYTQSSSFKETQNLVFKSLREFANELQNLKSVKEVRHYDGLMAIELNDHHNLKVTDFLKNNLFLNISGNNLIICPFLNSSVENLKNALTKVKDIITKI